MRPNSARPGAVRAPISPGCVSRGASPPCLGFGQGPAGGGLLPALLRGSLETEAALFQPVRPNSARPAAVRAPISPGRVSRGASPPCLGFAQGPAGGGLLPALLRGSLETEAALFQPVRPNSARPAAVQAPISPGRVSRGASPPCLGFGQGGDAPRDTRPGLIGAWTAPGRVELGHSGQIWAASVSRLPLRRGGRRPPPAGPWPNPRRGGDAPRERRPGLIGAWTAPGRTELGHPGQIGAASVSRLPLRRGGRRPPPAGPWPNPRRGGDAPRETRPGLITARMAAGRAELGRTG